MAAVRHAPANPSALLDEVAQALVLADVDEPATLTAIVDAVAALRTALGSSCDYPAVAAFADDADAVAAGPRAGLEAGLEALGARYDALKRAVEAAVAASGAGSSPAESGSERQNADRQPAMPLADDPELLRDFVVRSVEHLDTATEQLLVLEKNPSDAEALNAVFRVFHTIKGMAGFLALTEIEELAHGAESAIDAPRRGAEPLSGDAFDAVFHTVDEMRSLVAAVLGEDGSTTASSFAGSGRPAASVAVQSASTPQRRSGTNSVRVDEERLDKMLDMVGELVIAESMFSEAARSQESSFDSLAAQLSRLDKITRELQEMATSLRMVPLHGTFVRAARLVRDVSRKAGKRVDLVKYGDDTELDKLVVDRIYDPLVHILRNAVDHGIEQPEMRRAAGKPETGRIELRAYHSGGGIHIEIRDDGAGLDRARVLERARERGLVGDDQTPSEEELLALLFEPGFSTSDTVTDISGRGVGMDVVRRTVESLRGQVDAIVETGHGMCISIRLPLTLAIIDGMVVRTGDERYIIPTLSIERSLRPTAEEVSGVLGQGSLLQLDGGLVPLVPLGGLFGIDGAEEDPTKAIVVVVGDNGDRVGLVACEILGQQQIVIKSLGHTRQFSGIAGGAIMPDGRVGLIVDVGELVRLARS